MEGSFPGKRNASRDLPVGGTKRKEVILSNAKGTLTLTIPEGGVALTPALEREGLPILLDDEELGRRLSLS